MIKNTAHVNQEYTVEQLKIVIEKIEREMRYWKSRSQTLEGLLKQNNIPIPAAEVGGSKGSSSGGAAGSSTSSSSASGGGAGGGQHQGNGPPTASVESSRSMASLLGESGTNFTLWRRRRRTACFFFSGIVARQCYS